MKDRESLTLHLPPRRRWKQTRPRSREAVALALSALRKSWGSQRLSAGLGVARGSRDECRLLLRRLAADRRRSTATL